MFTSLNVVRIAAVDCDCTSRSATRCRSRDIGTRCSGRAPQAAGSLIAGAWNGAGAGARAAGASAVAGAAAGTALSPARAAPTARTSPLVTRPPRPVPATSPGLRFCSAISLRAAGNAPAAACGVAVTAGAEAASCAAAGAVTAASPGAAPFASVSMTAMTSCALTVAPSDLRISVTIPEPGAGNSSTTLSVSTSTRFSSRLTASPAFLCQLTSVASVIDSGRTGTLTSMSISLPRPRRSMRGYHLARRELRCERFGDQLLLLRQMLGRVADRRRCRDRAARIGQYLLLADVPAQVRSQPVPRALVLRLFLAPDDFGGIRILDDLRLEVGMRKRILLLEPDHRHVGDVVRAPEVDEVVIDFATAHDNAAHVLGDELVGFGDHRVELAFGELLQRRHGGLVPQQAFRAHDDQRLAKVAHHLPAQQMEDLRRSGRHANLHVVLGAELQIALRPRRRMLGPLPFVAVRQEQRESADAAPFDFAGGDELVDDDLCAVGKIAELRLPDHQPVGLRRRVAVLESEHRLLGQYRIDDLEFGLIFPDVLQRNPRARVPLLTVLIVQHGVPVRERPPRRVLPGKPHAVTLIEQARIREGLAHAPVERQLAFAHRAPIGNYLFDARVELEVRRHVGDLPRERLQRLHRHRGFRCIGPMLAEEGRPIDSERRLVIRKYRGIGVESLVHRRTISGDHAFGLLGLEHSVGHQTLCVQRASTRVLAD